MGNCIRLTLGLALLASLAGAPAAAHAEDTSSQIPEKAVCRTCAYEGSTHGEEEVAAWREYEGEVYYFCSKKCAEKFDSFPAAFVTKPIPRPAPEASVTMLSGETLHLDRSRGRVLLVDFWATWCKPCHAIMPALNELQEGWQGKPVSVLGISIDRNGKRVVPKFIEDREIDYPIALDDQKDPAWQAFAVASIPAMFLIDQKGQIVGEWRGRIDPDEVGRMVDELLKTDTTEGQSE